MENESVTLTVTMTLNDYLAFQWHHIKVFMILVFLHFSFITASLIRNGRAVGLPLSVLLLIVVAGVIGALLFFLMKKHFTDLYKSNKLIQQEQTFLLTLDGFEERTKTATAKYTWQELYASAETKTAFYVYIAKEQCFILPKRMIAHDKQTAFIRHCLRQLPSNKGKQTFLVKVCTVFIPVLLAFVIFAYVLGSTTL